MGFGSQHHCELPKVVPTFIPKTQLTINCARVRQIRETQGMTMNL